jgi:FkbM family methyltransferase
MAGVTAIRIADGSRVVAPDMNSVVTTYALREQEDWFEDEIRFVRKLAFPGMRSIDIGASYGLYTLALARGSGPDGRVFSFEPTPDTADCLAKSLLMNGCDTVTLQRLAVSSRTETRLLAVRQSSEYNALLSADAASGGIPVATVRLDDLLDTFGDRIDFLKMDAEGEEEGIIDGATRFFCVMSPLVMYELNCDGRINTPLISRFAALGYDNYRLSPGLGALVPFSDADTPDPSQLNLFSCAKERAQWLADAGLLTMCADRSENAAGREGEWERLWRNNRFSAAFAATSGAPDDASPRARRYLKALDLLCVAEDEQVPLSRRCGALVTARESLSMVCAVSPTVPRLCALARACFALGFRTEAARALDQALDLFARQNFELTREPFFAPAPLFDNRASRDSMERGLFCAMLEQLLLVSSYSGCFDLPRNIRILELLEANGVINPAIERRRQLVNMATGAQSGPLPTPLVCVTSEDNLNPEYWQGVA